MRSLAHVGVVSFAIAVCFVVSWAGTATAQSSIELRLIDRATVRIIAVAGVQPVIFRSEHTGVSRIPGVPNARHGSGVVIREDGLVLTAAHVTSGADAVAVLMPGQTRAVAARVAYVDPDHDVALLGIPGPVQHWVGLPAEDPQLRISEPVTASGYPLDVSERLPAAVAGSVSRENNDGSLQLAMGVNPGNSGGPVINDAGEIIGLLSRRGEPQAGIENIAMAVPLRHLRAAAERAVAALTEEPLVLGPQDATMARVVADFVRTSDERPIYEQTSLPLLHEATRLRAMPEYGAIVATHAWNMAVAMLENRRRRAPDGLSASDREKAEWLLNVALRLAREIDESAPYVRVRYPILRSIMANDGQPFVPPTPPPGRRAD